MDAASAFVGKVTTLIIGPLIGLIFAVAFAFGVYGLIMSVIKADDPKELANARTALFWALVGFTIMVGAVAILSIVTNTFCGTPFCR